MMKLTLMHLKLRLILTSFCLLFLVLLSSALSFPPTASFILSWFTTVLLRGSLDFFLLSIMTELSLSLYPNRAGHLNSLIGYGSLTSPTPCSTSLPSTQYI